MNPLERRIGESFEDWIARVTVSATEKRTPTTFDADLVPEPEYTPSPESLEIDGVLSGISIVDAYERWCGKSAIRPGNRREGVKVSCPNPEHPDKHPSAWLNLDKGDGGVGHCGSCGIGFDKYDIYAWGHGLPVPEYKTKFNEVKKNMAIDLGYTVNISAGHATVTAPEPEPEPDDEPGTPVAPVVDLFPSKEEFADMAADDFEPPFFNWRDLPAIKPDTFLHTWLTITSEADEPEEYYTWLGFEALGLAVSNNVTLRSIRPYRSNLMLCLVGPPAVGKTTAIAQLTGLLHEALPFKREVGNAGVMYAQQIASGEALIDALSITVEDPVTKEESQLPIRALIGDAEMAALMGRAGRNGNPLKESMQQFYDFAHPVESYSRTTGHRKVNDHFVSFVTSTQHERIEDLLRHKDEASGFISRWLFIYGTPKPRFSRRMDSIDTTPCVEYLRKIRAWAASTKVVDFHDDASKIRWDRFFETQLNPVVVGAKSSALARLDLMCRKILLLFAINDRSTSILVEHIQSLEILFPYMLKGYGVIHEAVTTDPLAKLMDRIEAFVGRYHAKQNLWPTRRDISKGFPRNVKDSQYAIDILVKDGRLVEMIQKSAAKSGGRPTTRYRLAESGDPTTTYMTP